ncbi:unnamed protein product [Pylaiella littoralis]
MPRLQPLALAYFVLATLTSAAGVRGIGDDVVAPDQPESRELDLVSGVKSIDLGCFRNKRRDRVFPRKYREIQINMTPETCASHCLGLGEFEFYALQGGRECWCGRAGTNIDKFGALPDERCSDPCPGNAKEECGGKLSFRAFKFQRAPPRPDYLGCFVDEKCDRLFETPVKTLGRNNDPETCRAACGPGFAYYGLQSGNECWCGKAHEEFDKLGPTKHCAHRCTGDYTATCGGFNAMEVFAMHCAS